MDVYKDLKNIKRIITKFNTLKCWEKFSASNLFYVSLENYNTIVLFTDTINDDTFGMYFIYEKEGYNFLYNTLIKGKNDIMEYYHLDAISLEVVYKDDLDESDRMVLHSQNLKVCNVNVFLGVNKPGKVMQGCDRNEIHLVNECLSYIEASLVNAKKNITSNFEKGLHTFIKVSQEKKEAIVSFGKIPIKEISYTDEPLEEEYYYKLKNASYIDETIDCYCNYLPITYDKIRPLFILFYYPKSRTLVLNLCLGNDEKAVFTTFERVVAVMDLPVGIRFNNNKIYSIMKNTLTSLKIESSYNIFSSFDKYFNHLSYNILKTNNYDLEMTDSNINDFMANLEDIFYNFIENEDDIDNIVFKRLIQ